MRIITATAALILGAFPAVSQEVSVERGLYVSIIAGCHDCHTEGYGESKGKIDPTKALKGNPVGWQGPWGTTYAGNLRYTVSGLTERGFVVMAKHIIRLPPMPWYDLQVMEESDVQSLYQYIKSLGEPGEPLHHLPPGVEPSTPYIVLDPPQMPKPAR